jgi:hypothetical protein
MPTTPEQVALVQSLLPSVAVDSVDDGGYGWDGAYIVDLMDTNSFTPTEAVRFFWLERVNETAEYLDTSKPLTQIHRQAKEMLDYWDNILRISVNSLRPLDPTDPLAGSQAPMSFGEIERPTG